MEEDDKVTCGYCCQNFFKYHWRGIVFILVPIIFLPLIVNNWERPYRCLYVFCVMALLFLTEAVPIYVTGLMPVLLLPVFGIMDSAKVAVIYFKDPLVFFAASLIVALSIEHCNLHKRIALRIIMMIGLGPKRLLASVIFLSAFLSMWFQNTAVTASMCPIVRALLDEFQGQGSLKVYKDREPGKPDSEAPEPTKMATGYYLAVAYAATIGGCSTLIGTTTNITFKGIYESRFPNATEEITFNLFMAYNVPWVIVDLILLFFILGMLYLGMCRPSSEEGEGGASMSKGAAGVTEMMKQKYEELGPMTAHENQVIILFILMILLLLSRKPGFISGWASFIPDKTVGSSAPVVAIVILLFYLPQNYAFFRYCFYKGPFPNDETKSLLNWRYIHVNFPWGLLFLVGGGFALATASVQSGMSDLISDNVGFFKNMPIAVVQLFAIIVGAFFTAFSANVAVCNILVPVMAEIAVGLKVHPLDLIYPAGLGCSIAFFLPVSTPPNAIITSYANIKTKSLVLAGIMPTITTLVCIYATVLAWHRIVHPATKDYPSWVRAI